MALAGQALVMVHLKQGVDLGHRIEVDADEDQERSAAQEVGQLAGEAESCCTRLAIRAMKPR